jgi:hypothetical protein
MILLDLTQPAGACSRIQLPARIKLFGSIDHSIQQVPAGYCALPAHLDRGLEYVAVLSDLNAGRKCSWVRFERGS